MKDANRTTYPLCVFCGLCGGLSDSVQYDLKSCYIRQGKVGFCAMGHFNAEAGRRGGAEELTCTVFSASLCLSASALRG